MARRETGHIMKTSLTKLTTLPAVVRLYSKHVAVSCLETMDDSTAYDNLSCFLSDSFSLQFVVCISVALCC